MGCKIFPTFILKLNGIKKHSQNIFYEPKCQIRYQREIQGSYATK